MTPGDELSRAVRGRADQRCQYCLMHESLQGATFHIEHIIPRSKFGLTELANLALACPSCNLHKASRMSAVDPMTGVTVELFHPLRDKWSEHFRIDGYKIRGVTPIGRATAHALKFNDQRRQRIRRAEESFGLYPPRT